MLQCRLLQQFDKCDLDVLRALYEMIAELIVELFLSILLCSDVAKKFTDWGSLLLSKEVRLVQNHIQLLVQKAMSTYQHQGRSFPALTSHWERLAQAVTILQLEKPSDWTFYESTSVFSSDELKALLELRVDFSTDAISAVVSTASTTAPTEQIT
jgi:hypothetical protein